MITPVFLLALLACFMGMTFIPKFYTRLDYKHNTVAVLTTGVWVLTLLFSVHVTVYPLHLLSVRAVRLYRHAS